MSDCSRGVSGPGLKRPRAFFCGKGVIVVADKKCGPTDEVALDYFFGIDLR